MVRVSACEESRVPQLLFKHRADGTGRSRRDRSERETGVVCGVTKNRKTKRAQHHAGIYAELRDFFEVTLDLCVAYRIILNSINL